MLTSNKGMAVFEMIPLIVILMMLLNYTYGFFGVIHAGILGQMSARNYAFETFRHRADLTYQRNSGSQPGDEESLKYHFDVWGQRVHANTSELKIGSDRIYATTRQIDFFHKLDVVGNTESNHNDRVDLVKTGKRFKFGEDGQGANPVWLRTQYGICLNSSCVPEILGGTN